MTGSSYKKGARIERELVNHFRDLDGWEAMRGPASGGGNFGDRENNLPDLMVGGGPFGQYAFEVKARANTTHIYIERDKIQRLIKFSEAFDMTPLVAARFDYHDFEFYRPHDLPTSRGGRPMVRAPKSPDGESLNFDERWLGHRHGVTCYTLDDIERGAL